jgi:putative oxidoreductase
MQANRPLSLAITGYRQLIRLSTFLKCPLLLVIRLFWGWQFFQTGWGKLTHLEKTTDFFKDLGIPLPALNATMAGATECFGGLLLLIGLGSRLISLPLIVTMIVAYLTADMDAVKGIFSDPDAFTSAAPFLFLFSSLLILVFGPGKISVDHLIGRKIQQCCPPSSASCG